MYTLKVNFKNSLLDEDWFFLYKNCCSMGRNPEHKVIFETYREALDTAKKVWDTDKWEVKIIRL